MSNQIYHLVGLTRNYVDSPINNMYHILCHDNSIQTWHSSYLLELLTSNKIELLGVKLKGYSHIDINKYLSSNLPIYSVGHNPLRYDMGVTVLQVLERNKSSYTVLKLRTNPDYFKKDIENNNIVRKSFLNYDVLELTNSKLLSLLKKEKVLCVNAYITTKNGVETIALRKDTYINKG